MVRNRSRTTCNLPGTLVGHSKITISLLNSAWFARYSGFLVWVYLARRLVSVVGGGGIYEKYFRPTKNRRQKKREIFFQDEKNRDEKKIIDFFFDNKIFGRKKIDEKNCPKKFSTEKMFVRKKIGKNIFR